MSGYRKYFLHILSLLNEHRTNEVKDYLNNLSIRYEYVTEHGLISHLSINDHDQVIGKYYNILFYLNRNLNKYMIATPNPRKNSFNTDPSTLVSYAISSKQTPNIKVPSIDIGGDKKDIIVFSDMIYTNIIVERAKEIYGFKALLSEDKDVLKSMITFYEQGYRYFIIGRKIEDINLLTEWITSHKDVRIVDYYTTDINSTNSHNILRMNCSTEYMCKAYASCINKPTLFITDQEHLDQANRICELLPGSIVKHMVDENIQDIVNSSTLDSVFMLLSNNKCNINCNNKVLWVNEEHHKSKFNNDDPIHSISLYYPPSIRCSKMFKHASMTDYLAVDALYYLDYYIRTGTSLISGLTGLYEFDANGNRLWFSFVKIMHHSGIWVQNYITEI